MSKVTTMLYRQKASVDTNMEHIACAIAAYADDSLVPDSLLRKRRTCRLELEYLAERLAAPKHH
jgi:hypothetical protein